eukprot:m.130609 g.130609  ORF g.130609 m.130609 type:complete len:204 (-) comp9790_c0_seq2:403-1014(-)
MSHAAEAAAPPDEAEHPMQAVWEAQQSELKARLAKYDDHEWTLDTLRYVGGVDISFIKGNDVDACAGLVVLELPSMNVVYEDFEMVQLDAPYIPGFLAFREVKFLDALLEKLRKQHPELIPELILVDGNGYLHYRGFGLACHLGVLADIPTIGIGKNLLCVDGLTNDAMHAEANEKLHEKGDWFPLPRDGCGCHRCTLPLSRA